MNVTMRIVLVDLAMLAGMLAFLGLGRWLADRHRTVTEHPAARAGSIEGAVFALFGLLIAFTFSGAADRFNRRRELILEEANLIGSTYQLLDLLPPEAQPRLRELFREYVRSRLATYQKLSDRAGMIAELQRSKALQAEIWQRAVSAAQATGNPGTLTLVASSLNEMTDITTTRLAALRSHMPTLILGMLMALGVATSLVAGYAMEGRRWSWFHAVVFAVVIATTIHLILDLEYPRFGLIRVDDLLLVEVLQDMK